MKRRSRFRVSCGPWTVDVNANNRGNAYRKVFEALIERGYIKRQPRPVNGAYEDTSCVCIGKAN